MIRIFTSLSLARREMKSARRAVAHAAVISGFLWSLLSFSAFSLKHRINPFTAKSTASKSNSNCKDTPHFTFRSAGGMQLIWRKPSTVNHLLHHFTIYLRVEFSLKEIANEFSLGFDALPTTDDIVRLISSVSFAFLQTQQTLNPKP